MRKVGKLLFAVALGIGSLVSLPPEASALFQNCSAFFCSGSPTRKCTCPGSSFTITCGTWVPGQPCGF